MIYGLYHSAQGAEAQSLRLNVMANNLANASTSAFKRDLIAFQDHKPFDLDRGTGNEPPHRLNDLSGGMTAAEVVTDFSDGPLQETGGNLDVALVGPGFLRVSDETGEYLTRDGRLALNDQGELVTNNGGRRVGGTGGGAIVVPPEASRVQISADGGVFGIIRNEEGLTQQELGRLDIVRPESPAALKKIGNNLYAFDGSPVAAHQETEIKQGYIEGSGVNPIMEMLELIEASRAFETNINMMKFQDEALGRLLQSTMNR